MIRYLKLAIVQLRISAAAAMTYRADFLLEGVMAVLWFGLTVLPLIVVYSARDSVAGWDAPAALIVIAFFMGIRAVLEGLVSPSLIAMVEQIRSGAFDYVLLKPADAQALVSSARIEPWKVFDLIGAIGLVVYALIVRGTVPEPLDVMLAVVLFVGGVLTMYAFWVICASASFWVVRLDNLPYLLGAVFDTARWPVHVFRGLWRIVFTFVIPVAVMTTFPAMALLGTATSTVAIGSLVGAFSLVVVSRLVWRSAIRNYTSASS
ncbi:MAG: ABC transporter permease [Kofleriaceae bacterium]